MSKCQSINHQLMPTHRLTNSQTHRLTKTRRHFYTFTVFDGLMFWMETEKRRHKMSDILQCLTNLHFDIFRFDALILKKL